MVRISKQSNSTISIFELQRVENCISRLCPSPFEAASPTQIGGKTLEEGLNHAVHRAFDHCEWLEYQKNRFQESLRREVVRSSAGAGVAYPPFFGVIRVAYPKA